MTSERSSFELSHSEIGLGILLGLWLLVSPLVLGFSGHTAAAWNDAIIGVGALGLKYVLDRHETRWRGYAALLLGLWLMISPWVLGYSHTAMALWNNVVAGIILAGAGVAHARDSTTQHPVT